MKKKLITESGIRNIRELSKRYPEAKIYFHQDLDGVTTALGMKSYLEQNGIKVVDSEIIQYGDKEFAIKKLDAEGDVMPVLVDFAHVNQCLLYILTTTTHKRGLNKVPQLILNLQDQMLRQYLKQYLQEIFSHLTILL